MTKDEMKNRISLALKDPILQQGFEIICKNLEELEKENARLTTNEKSLIAERKIIVKENAELKGTVIKMNNVITETFSNLTKAKELLKKVVTDFHNRDCVSVHIDRTIAKAEQFLKDSEVKK